ncbi:Ycf48-like protein [Crateriforma conspicua]|uniref:Ycf48-like protein n=2 Tax=Planctomycetaceae TaxID=126 RepID=A0A5C6FZF3_9PLAN|nr:Ycf48-like protein [Crateriforma conspicua]
MGGGCEHHGTFPKAPRLAWTRDRTDHLVYKSQVDDISSLKPELYPTLLAHHESTPIMNRRCLATFVAFAAHFLAVTCQAHVPHDIIYSLDVSPTFQNDGLVFASSTQFGEAHLMSSTFGETFSESHAGMQQTLVTGHTFSPNFSTDGIVYMVTHQGYYKSVDRGRNWEKQKDFADEQVLSICFANDETSIYVLTRNGLHRIGSDGLQSVDGYPHQNDVSPSDVTFGKLQRVGNRLFVHQVFYETPKRKNGMDLVDYRTGTVHVLDTDRGEWDSVGDLFASKVITDFDVSADGHTALIALKDGTVHRSVDQCQTWTQVFSRKDDFVCKLKMSPDFGDDQTIACGTAKGFVFLSQNGGDDWTVRSNGLSRWVHHVNILINQIAFSPNYRNDKTIFLGKTTGVYKTTDSGKFWRHINVWNPKWGYFVYPAPGEPSRDVFAATYNGGIYRSHDNGMTWSSANIGITSAFANGMELSPNYEVDKTIFVLDIATGLYRSADAGRSWSHVVQADTAKVIGKPVLYRKMGVSPDFADDGLIFLFSVPRRILGVPEKHVWSFNDKTNKLSQLSIGKSNNYINRFAFTPRGSKQKLVFAATAQGIFRSQDAGESWTQVSPIGSQKLFVSPDFDEDGLVYSMDAGGRLHRSIDEGQTFEPTKLGLDGKYIDNLTFSPRYADDQTLFASTFGEGVFRSQDAGRTWSHFGLRGKWLYSGPAFSSGDGDDSVFFAPTVDGIYRSTDDGRSWNNVLRTIQRLPKVPLLMLRDPNGKEIPLTFGTPEEMKRYDAYDAEVGDVIFARTPNLYQKIKSPHAYLASYYKFRANPGYAVEIHFYGTGVEYKCVQSADLGIVDIELDGKPQGQFDLYSERDRFDVTGYERQNLKQDYHVLRIVATGEKNQESSGTAMTFNAANITND